MYVYYANSNIYFVFNDVVKQVPYRGFNFVRSPQGEYTDLNGERWSLTTERFYDHDGGVKNETKFLYQVFQTMDNVVEDRLFIDYFDIETRNSLDVTNAAEPVISITYYSSRQSKYFVFYLGKEEAKVVDDVVYIPRASEKEMLLLFFNSLSKFRPSYIVGWNSDGYDWKYLLNRVRRLFGPEKATEIFAQASPFHKASIYEREGPVLHILGVNLADLMQLFIRFVGEENSYALDAIATKHLGEGKVELSFGLVDAWEHDREQFFKYAIRDVSLLKRLNEKFKLIELVNMLGIITLTPPVPFTGASRKIEGLIFKKIFPRKQILPPKALREEVSYSGAFVKNPRYTGLIDGPMFVFDFVSLYPNLIRTLNISPQTKSLDGPIRVKLPGEKVVRFLQPTQKQSVISEIINELFPLRLEYKKRMKEFEKGSNEYNRYYILQYTLKVLLNSFYGYMGFPHAALFDRDCAEAITTAGRQVITTMERVIEQLGKEVIYIDTDSLFVKGLRNREEAAEFLQKVNSLIPQVSEKLWNVKSEYLRLDLDKEITRAIFFSKKQYAYIDVDEMLHETGTFTIKSDVPVFVQWAFRKLFEQILKQEIDFTEEYFQQWIREQKKQFFSAPLSEIGISKSVRKEVERYNKKGMPFHVRGLITYLKFRSALPANLQQRFPMIRQGKVLSYYLTEENPLRSTAFSIPDFIAKKDELFSVIEHYIDREKQWAHTFVKKAQIVQRAFGFANIDYLIQKNQPKKAKKYKKEEEEKVKDKVVEIIRF